MPDISDVLERRTTTDLVFDQLRDEIVSLALLPGAKLSEAEIARRFGVSRQPVRDAFTRLESLDLLVIRPQKATKVRGFSRERIDHARFVRLAVELEVIRSACAVWDSPRQAALQGNLDQQQRVIETGNPEAFHALDYEFHKLICELGGHPLAFDTIEECKQRIDRLCVLSLGRASEAATLFADHQEIASGLMERDAARATAAARRHLARLDDTIAEIHRKHADFFD
ncbi:GntR family transcriptional regulator [uncultured Roseobacter sp.]|uniref:GntR family transcriptional regulator n=1 Tax=uncultured Roseobacter sp. TaxID=114847 RepID=UPI00262DF64A|nr:GntR family transcriptional regulator [uncultured Roseobacter sp.]